jgi:leucyl-tRNA synthetase
MPATLSPALTAIRRTTHKTIAAVTDDLDKFRFNRAVARIRELTNTLDELPAAEPGASEVFREGLDTLAQLLGPMMPHLAEEIWQTLGGKNLLADQPWPKADPDLTRDEQVTIAVQVNGKLRGTLDIPRDTDTGAIEVPLLQCLRCCAGSRPAAAQSHRRAKPDRQHRRVTVSLRL